MDTTVARTWVTKMKKAIACIIAISPAAPALAQQATPSVGRATQATRLASASEATGLQTCVDSMMREQVSLGNWLLPKDPAEWSEAIRQYTEELQGVCRGGPRPQAKVSLSPRRDRDGPAIQEARRTGVHVKDKCSGGEPYSPGGMKCNYPE